MRKSLKTLLAAAMAVSAIAVPAGANVEAPVGQSVSGTIALPQPTKAAVNVTRHQRSTIFVGSQSQGIVSWYVEIDPDTNGGLFDLTSTADTDLDIIFYSNPGNLTDASESAGEFIGTVGSGESGVVPLNATHAIIYPASGANVPFEYTATEAQTVLLSGDLDVEVDFGQRLVFINDTDEYGFVRGAKFDSGSGPASGLASGERFTLDTTSLNVLFGSADITYETHTGTGTITVNG